MPTDRPHGMMFHHFHDHVHPRGQGAISADDFAHMIRFLQDSDYKILRADDFLDRAVNGRLRPGETCITFDDTLRCQYDVALPVLDDLGLTAFWFVYSSVFRGDRERLEVYRLFRTIAFSSVEEFYDEFFPAAEKLLGPVYAIVLKQFDSGTYLSAFPFYSDRDRLFRYLRDRVLGPAHYDEVMDVLMADRRFDQRAATQSLWLNEDHLKTISGKSHLIGLHSYSHPARIEDLPLGDQALEYWKNLQHLQGLLGSQIRTMSHPCNSYHQGTLSILREIGIEMAFCSNMAAPGGLLEMPREDHMNVMRRMADQGIISGP